MTNKIKDKIYLFLIFIVLSLMTFIIIYDYGMRTTQYIGMAIIGMIFVSILIGFVLTLVIWVVKK